MFGLCLAAASNGTAGNAIQQSQPQQQQQQVGGQMQISAAGGQPDYSKQWAEYYRSIGKIDEAEAIENQIKATKVK